MPRIFKPTETPDADTAPSIEEIDREILEGVAGDEAVELREAAASSDAPAEASACSAPAPVEAAPADILDRVAVATASTSPEAFAVRSLPKASAAEWTRRIASVEQRLTTAKTEVEQLSEQSGVIELLLDQNFEGAEQLAIDHRDAVLRARIKIEGLGAALVLAKRQRIEAEREEANTARDRKIVQAQSLGRQQIAIAGKIDAVLPTLLSAFNELDAVTRKVSTLRLDLPGVAIPSAGRLASKVHLERVLSHHGDRYGKAFAETLQLPHAPPHDRLSMVDAQRGAWKTILAMRTEAGATAELSVSHGDEIANKILDAHPELLVSSEDEPDVMARKSDELDTLVAERLKRE